MLLAGRKMCGGKYALRGRVSVLCECLTEAGEEWLLGYLLFGGV